MESYCFCPYCGMNDDHWTFVEDITFECDNCERQFEDLNAAWWFESMQDNFWDEFWSSFKSTGRR